VQNCLINLNPDAESKSGRTASGPVELIFSFFWPASTPSRLCSVSHVFVKKDEIEKRRVQEERKGKTQKVQKHALWFSNLVPKMF